MGFAQLSSKAQGLSRNTKRRIVMLVDASLCAMAVLLAINLRIGALPDPSLTTWLLALASIALALPIFAVAGMYRQIFSESGLRSLMEIARACAVYGLAFSAIFTFTGFVGIPRTVGLIQPILLFLLVSASRLFARRWAPSVLLGRSDNPVMQVIIYGAGSAGRQIAAALHTSRQMRVVAFVDDDSSLHGSAINGVPVHRAVDVRSIADRLNANNVLLAIPSASQHRRNAVIEQMRAAMLHVTTLPGIMDIANGRIEVSDIRELELDDLLGRNPIPPRPELMGRNITGKTVLVTGAGGSIGSELCRQILAAMPSRLLLFEQSEYDLYRIEQEIDGRRGSVSPGTEVIPLLGSVTNVARVRAVLNAWAPDTIYHAAAYKHVPLVENNPLEGVANNVGGTFTVAQIAAELEVPHFVLISTDKAVRPTNVMGASKRAAELALQALNASFPTTRFSIVRFGNVLGSSGSVVPLFRRQIKLGGPVTITDARIIRYFMSIPEAAQLVIQAGAMARGGEVFVLDMGDPIRIADLARRMIELSGRSVRDQDNPDGDITIEEIGLRPGEKLYEELLIGDDPEPTEHPRILKANERFIPLPQLRAALDGIDAAIAAGDAGAVVNRLKELVPEYRSEKGLADWVTLRRQAAESTAVAAKPAYEVISGGRA